MSRSQNIRNNLIFNVLKFVIQLVLQFVLRTCLIYYLGIEYLGLDGLFTNVFSFLNLAELGIGTAIVFNMYKPIAEKNIEKVKSLQSLYKKFYVLIAIVVATMGIIIAPFIPKLISGEVRADVNIYILFFMYLIYTLMGYFSAQKRSVLFAYQRNDIENRVKIICVIISTILQILMVILTKNYYVYFSILIVFSLIECVLIKLATDKMFPELKGPAKKLDKETKQNLFKGMTAVSMHKISNVVVFSTDQILISTFLGITVLGAYSNYYMIIASIFSVFMIIFNSLSASAGDLMVNQTKEYVYDRFKQINVIFSFLSAFCTICLICLFQPFIKIWTGGGIYLLDFSTVIIICISFYFSRMRQGVLVFKEAGGYYSQDKWRTILEVISNLFFSIILVKLIGINGIFLGTIISSLLGPFITEPRVLYKYYFKKPVSGYYKRYIIDFIITALVGSIMYFIISFIPDGGIWLLIAKFLVCVPLCAILLIVAFLPIKEFKEVLYMAKSWIKSFLNRKRNSKIFEMEDKDEQ